MTIRKTETKNKIKKSLVYLINTKGFEALTVSDITRHSQINRGTFYLHYIDKYDLLEKLEEEAENELRYILSYNIESYSIKDRKNSDLKDIVPYENILNALIYINNDSNFIKALMGENGNPRFVEKFKNLLREVVKKFNQCHIDKGNDKKIPKEYILEIIITGIISIVTMWIKRDFKETPQQIADIISESRSISPIEFLALLNE